MASITLEHVWKIYNSGQQEEVEAVRDVSLSVEDGAFVSFLGPSGCGKTSILRMIAGLEKITRGVIRIGDRTVNHLNSNERNIAMAFETYALYPHLNVRDNLTFCLRARKMGKEDIETRVKEIANILKIDKLLDKRPTELPGGQQQLVSVARAMIRNPNVFLLDEPFSHLDASMRFEVRTRIKRVLNRIATTTILVTHDQHEAIAMADKIVVMNFAEVQQVGPAKDLFHRPANMFVAGFVGEPAINFLRAVLQRRDDSWYLLSKHANGCFPISEQTARAIQERGLEEVIVGIRPQEFLIAPVEDSYVRGVVSFFEFLGEESHLMVKSGETEVTAVTQPTLKFDEGEAVGLTVKQDGILVFDPKTELAIH
jgi:multiple sugar transport system ATP-binding protein